MIEKVNLKQVLVIVAVGLAVCFMFRCCGRESSNIEQLQADTNRTMGTVKAESAILGVEVERIERTTGTLGEALDGASSRIERCQESANAITNRIEQIKRTAIDCQRLARENAVIIDEADKSN